MHQVVPDGNGGVYLVSQKHVLGIGGKQTLLTCQANFGEATRCYTVVSGPEVADLGPQPPPEQGYGVLGALAESSGFGTVDSVLDLEELRGELEDLLDGLRQDDPLYGGTGLSGVGVQGSGLYDRGPGGGGTGSGSGSGAMAGEMFSSGDLSAEERALASECPEGAFVGQQIPANAAVELLAIHPDDAYFGVRFDGALPISGVSGGMTAREESCWIGGDFTADNGDGYYFYLAAFRLK